MSELDDEPKKGFGFLKRDRDEENEDLEDTEDTKDESTHHGWKWFLGVLIVALSAVTMAVSWWVSMEPDEFDVEAMAMKQARISNRDELVTGYVFTSTLAQIANTLLNKNGGYITNDVAPPMIFLDNMSNWEYGALVMLRDGSQALRNHLARAQSQSREDPDLADAEPHFNYDNNSWQLPSSEAEYQKGEAALRRYMARLQDRKGATFSGRADNLRAYLEVIEKRLGGLADKLSASTNEKISLNQTAGARRPPNKRATQTPWLEVDDIFYEARGACWALLHILKAVEYDFHDALARKQGEETMRGIIAELRKTQAGLLSPVILNGSGFGVQANYSLTMATYIARAASATMDLRERMTRG